MGAPPLGRRRACLLALLLLCRGRAAGAAPPPPPAAAPAPPPPPPPPGPPPPRAGAPAAAPAAVTDAIARRYAPRFVLDRAEPYHPCSVGDFMRNAELWRLGPRGAAGARAAPALLLASIPDPGAVAALSHPEAYVRLKRGGRGDGRRRRGAAEPALYPGPIEVYYRANAYDYLWWRVVDVYYNVFFAFNGTREPHYADSEWVVLRGGLDAGTGEFRPWRVWFSAHTGGYWRDWRDLDVERDAGAAVPLDRAPAPSGGGGAEPRVAAAAAAAAVGAAAAGAPPPPARTAVAVYVARESHALYPFPGRVRRFWGLGDDVCRPAPPARGNASAGGGAPAAAGAAARAARRRPRPASEFEYRLVSLDAPPASHAHLGFEGGREGSARGVDQRFFPPWRTEQLEQRCPDDNFLATVRARAPPGAAAALAAGAAAALAGAAAAGAWLRSPGAAAAGYAPAAALPVLLLLVYTTPLHVAPP